MKLYAPKYYRNFSCTAERCTHSCCVGWEIDIDKDALQKYRALSCGYAKEIMSSIDTAPTPHFRLGAGERCPHLDENGLCKIIINAGEEYLCDICREHPRFYNFLPGRVEAGLGMACEEACRIILSSDDYDTFTVIDEVGGEELVNSFDTISQRSVIYSLLADESVIYQGKLCRIYEKYGVSPSRISDDEWRDVIKTLEYLDESHKQLFMRYSSNIYTPAEYEEYLERALAYFIYRHCAEAWDEDDFRARLFFCLFCERLLASSAKVEKAKSIEDFVRLARIVSEEIEYSEDNTETIQSVFTAL